MGAFTISGEGYFDALSQPVLAAEKNKIVYLNPAARAAFPMLGSGDEVPQELPGEADAAAVAVMNGRRWMVRTFAAENGIVYQLTEQETTALSAEEAYSLSVGLKVTMSPMLSALEALQDQLAETELERSRKLLTTLNHQYYKLLHSVDSLSFYALSVSSAENLYLPETMNLTEACGGFWDDLHALVKMTGRTLTLKNADQPIFVEGDRRLLERLVCQLCSNAIKAGGDITIGLKRQGKRAILTVTDTGSGISNETLSSAFSAKPVRSGPYSMGVGFGLSICQEIARLHGGSLVISRRKKGTQAALSLPLKEGNVDKLNSKSWNLSGGVDSVLVEMSGVLPDACYDPAAL